MVASENKILSMVLKKTRTWFYFFYFYHFLRLLGLQEVGAIFRGNGDSLLNSMDYNDKATADFKKSLKSGAHSPANG